MGSVSLKIQIVNRPLKNFLGIRRFIFYNKHSLITSDIKQMWRYLNFQCELALQMISKYVPIKITEMLFCFRLVIAIQSGIMYISILTAARVSLAPAAAFIADIVRRFIALNVHPIVTYSGEWKKEVAPAAAIRKALHTAGYLSIPT